MNKIRIYKNTFWNYCFFISLYGFLGSIALYLIFWALVILLNITSLILNIIATILGFVIFSFVSFVIITILVVPRDV